MVRSSLIVLTFNGWPLLEPCLESLLKAMSEHDELIVVDNGSQDGTVELVKERFPAVTVVSLPTNTYIFGLNEGLKIARGKYVAFLNNDMTVDLGFVDRTLQEFVADDIFAVCPRILDKLGEDQGSRTSGYWSRGLIFYKPLPHATRPTNCFFAVGGQSFFDREKLTQLGSIDPLLWPMYHEDVELSYRAWKRGWRIVYAPEAVAHHLGGTTSRKVFTPTELRSFVRQNEYLTVWKNVTDRKLLMQHSILILPRLLVAAIKGDWATLLGFSRAVKRIRPTFESRITAKRHFVLSDAEVLRRVGSIR